MLRGLQEARVSGRCAKPYRDIQSDARFIHGTGHGLGLEIHEFPRISEADVVLEVGDVITVEPGLYDPNLGGIRIEDLVVVTEDGLPQPHDTAQDLPSGLRTAPATLRTLLTRGAFPTTLSCARIATA